MSLNGLRALSVSHAWERVSTRDSDAWMILTYTNRSTLVLWSSGCTGLNGLVNTPIPPSTDALYAFVAQPTARLDPEPSVLAIKYVKPTAGGVTRARTTVHWQTLLETFRGWTSCLEVGDWSALRRDRRVSVGSVGSSYEGAASVESLQLVHRTSTRRRRRDEGYADMDQPWSEWASQNPVRLSAFPMLLPSATEKEHEQQMLPFEPLIGFPAPPSPPLTSNPLHGGFQMDPDREKLMEGHKLIALPLQVVLPDPEVVRARSKSEGGDVPPRSPKWMNRMARVNQGVRCVSVAMERDREREQESLPASPTFLTPTSPGPTTSGKYGLWEHLARLEAQGMELIAGYVNVQANSPLWRRRWLTIRDRKLLVESSLGPASMWDLLSEVESVGVVKEEMVGMRNVVRVGFVSGREVLVGCESGEECEEVVAVVEYCRQHVVLM
ncbi:hypothetical protein SAICODRAFT_5697 [Saitoella complicata NRRL Y-17804]|uniref:uncharacterized protein n=1 Tax=Saitoella complicata (strain BCRC 22490 / CBS 7301 / JCM 7358 / NBRC 10748 / NRRL Y-17804) TaxID=698492 RepID=UPI000866E20B|nr:uncharacterized protein SAICODRAFT_5697 [Saitoella complicata NRRL Y-17804]ODQ55089.1 hypothetical protein SAICODRAFT_5697 [Saitoella complicata NRRL Y-17804]